MSDPDTLTSTKTIYDVGPWEIFWRNFLAGMARALGGLLIYFLISIVLVSLFTTYIWPLISPQFQMFGDSLELLQGLNTVPGYDKE